MPWRQIFMSKPVWAIIVANFCVDWGLYTYLTNIPTFFYEVLFFDIKSVTCKHFLTLMWFHFHEYGRSDTDIHLVSEYGRRPLRSSTDRTLTVPWTHNRFGDRTFAVAEPRLWNSLPISLRQISSYGQFRRYLKNHLSGIWEITAQCDAWFSALYKYSHLLTYLLKVRQLDECDNGCFVTNHE